MIKSGAPGSGFEDNRAGRPGGRDGGPGHCQVRSDSQDSAAGPARAAAGGARLGAAPTVEPGPFPAHDHPESRPAAWIRAAGPRWHSVVTTPRGAMAP
eukprot:753915-Hanusia_phi.AAC.1